MWQRLRVVGRLGGARRSPASGRVAQGRSAEAARVEGRLSLPAAVASCRCSQEWIDLAIDLQRETGDWVASGTEPGRMWATSLVHTDDSLKWQRRLVRSCSAELSVDSAGVKYLCEWEHFRRLGEPLVSLPPGLVFLGGSSFHHLSYHLIRRSAARPLKVVVFDRHCDVLPSPAGHVSCGSWITEVVKLPAVEGVLILGPDPAETPLGVEARCQVPWEADGSLAAGGLSGKVTWVPLGSARRELTRFCTASSRVYVSLDKDVLAEADTDWGSGTLRLGGLLHLLRVIQSQAKVVGADVCGELVPRGPWPSALEWAQIKRNEEINLAIWRTLSVRLRMGRPLQQARGNARVQWGTRQATVRSRLDHRPTNIYNPSQ